MNGDRPRPAPPPAARPAAGSSAAAQTGRSAAPGTGPDASSSGAGPDASSGPAPGAGRGPGSGHPAVDAALQGIANAATLAPPDQIAQYEAAHRVLRETLATIDQS